MKLFKKIVINFVFYAFPLALINLILLGLIMSKSTTAFDSIEIWAFIVPIFWTPTTLFLTIAMFFSRTLRDDVFSKLSGIKERDEREVQIVGKALKSTYLTTMTILLFLLIISLFNITVGEKSPNSVKPGELPSYARVGLGLDLLDPNAVITQKEDYERYFEINDLPISSSTLIIFLLAWQIFSYRFISRKLLRSNE